MGQNMSLVCGIVVSFNPDPLFFKSQLQPLIQQLDSLIVVDNGSVIQSDLQNISSFISSSIVFIKLDHNLGLAAAQNIGIKESFNLNATHIVLFDQDSLIDPGFISGLLEAEAALLATSKCVAAVGPLFFDPSNSVVYPASVYTGPFLKRVPLDMLNSEVEATFVIASGCLIRMEVLDRIGLMNDQLFIDYIDVEWCLRAKYKGFKSYMTSRAKMAHTIGENRLNFLGRTISIHSPLRRYYLIRNSIFMLRQPYIPLGYKVREVVFNLLRFLIGLAFSKDRKKYLFFVVWGIRDGISGALGSCKH